MLACFGRARLSAAALQIVWALLLGCVVVGTGGLAWGQTSVDGAISGLVVDASGAALAGAVVGVRSVSTGLESGATADGKGQFLVPRLRAGEYEVTALTAFVGRQRVFRVPGVMGCTPES